jgi:hypothetical protein
VLIAPILLLQIEITGFFIPFMAQLVYASPSNTRPQEVPRQIQKQVGAAKRHLVQGKTELKRLIAARYVEAAPGSAVPGEGLSKRDRPWRR